MIGGLSIESRNHCVFIQLLDYSVLWTKFCVETESAKPPLWLNLEIEALNKNIGHWETTWFNFRILHFIWFNLVGYDLHHSHSPHDFAFSLGTPTNPSLFVLMPRKDLFDVDPRRGTRRKSSPISVPPIGSHERRGKT